MKKVNIIIPIYIASLKILAVVNACLKSLEATKPKGAEIITVDDASPIPFEATVKHKINTGFTKTVNDGIKYKKADIYVIANDDIYFIDGWSEALLPLLDDKTVGISSLVTSDEGIEITSPIMENANFGSIWATRDDVIENVGYLDENMPHYFSDMDYKKRVLAKGYRVVKNTTLIIPHKGKMTYKEVDPHDERYFEGMEAYRKKYGKID